MLWGGVLGRGGGKWGYCGNELWVVEGGGGEGEEGENDEGGEGSRVEEVDEGGEKGRGFLWRVVVRRVGRGVG